MKRIMAVYDVDPFYAERFAEAVNQKEHTPFTVTAFTSMDRLKRYVEKNQVDLLLISNQVNREEVEGLGIKKVISLTEGESASAEYTYPSVYKYQSSAGILREVMARYCDREMDSDMLPVQGKAKILGVYSPVGRCLKTSFAITMGQLMASEHRVLYVTLEDFSGLSLLTGTEYKSDLSDLLYYFSQGNFNVLRLSTVVYSIGNLDYIPPARYPEDLSELSSEAMAQMIEKLASESSYEYLILDMGNYGHQVIPLLKICHVIYMPVKEDSISVSKVAEFERYLENTGNGEVKDRMKRLKLPYHSSFGRKEGYIEQLLWSELGDYVRQLLRGGERREFRLNGEG